MIFEQFHLAIDHVQYSKEGHRPIVRSAHCLGACRDFFLLGSSRDVAPPASPTLCALCRRRPTSAGVAEGGLERLERAVQRSRGASRGGYSGRVGLAVWGWAERDASRHSIVESLANGRCLVFLLKATTSSPIDSHGDFLRIRR